MTVYPTAMTHCAACGVRVKHTRHLCLYMAGSYTALSYVLCKRCSAPLRQGAGLAPDVLKKIERAMEPDAQAYGLTKVA